MRESAKILGCNYKTVYRKFLWLGLRAKLFHSNQTFIAERIQFDEMETLEHTKLKPLSIALAVSDTYQILGVEVATIPAKGHLAAISRSKYGRRKNESFSKTHNLLESVRSKLSDKPLQLSSDAKKDYRVITKDLFPNTPHKAYPSRDNKEKRREQKYLKAEKHIHDPLFEINHMCARLRDHIKRLTRRSWCTTKLKDHLELALYLYLAKNNNYKFI
ncbi:hypothetical protein D3C87_257430 [compost metagenome]